MLNPSQYRVVGFAGLIVAALAGVLSAQAGQSSSGDRMGELLTEVRGLRAELAQAAGASMRMQLLLARLSLQEQRITVLSRQLNEVQEQLMGASQGRSSMADRLSRVIASVQSIDVPAEERKAIEQEIPHIKRQLAEQQQRELQLQTQAAEISAVISAEQGRWLDFNARLDELEHSLSVGASR
jgi:chromosome segregation ATPase